MTPRARHHHRARRALGVGLAAALAAASACARERGTDAERAEQARALGQAYFEVGRLDSAEAQLRRAWALDSANARIALLLARIHAAEGRTADARARLEPLVRGGTDDPVALYSLAQLDTAPASSASRLDLLRRIVARAPTNLAVRLEMLDAFVLHGDADSATGALEEIRRLPPEPPTEALAPFARLLPLLQAGRLSEARTPLRQFRLAMELTPAYQTSLATLLGVNGSAASNPGLTFSPGSDVAGRARVVGPITDAARFTEATAAFSLASADTSAIPAAQRPGAQAIAVGDYDGDGIEDLFASRWDATARGFTARLYRAERGAFRDESAAAGIALDGGARFALFADYDNDGWLDLLAVDTGGRCRLFRNGGRRQFRDVTAKAGLGDASGAAKALFADLDHDGDLDLVTVGPAGLRAMRNNADGTFSEQTAEFGLLAPGEPRDARDVAFADFDGDGRLDLFVSRARGQGTLFRNVGARRFADATAASGLAAAGGAGAIAVSDFDNDGTFDLLLAPTEAGEPALWSNRGDGTFVRARRAATGLRALRGLRVAALQSLDFDNDGWLDLVAAGAPGAAGAAGAAGARGVVLLRNDGAGGFEDRSSLLGATTLPGAHVATLDLSRDGDEDLVLADPERGLRVFRNDGGNANLFVQVRLAALRTGSGKNNVFGIGARLALRVGDVVQTRVVTRPIMHFGLGTHLKADVLRVEWSNGVPQVIHFPGSDQDVLELELLKSSCGFLYAWDGTRFRFVTDVMWRSALGMPLGIMGSNTAWAPAGASQEYLRIAGSALQPRDGRYVLQLTEELWETSYTDEVRLIAVDHPDSVDVAVNERFIPPGPISLRLYQAVRSHPPRTARDDAGTDLLPALRARDDVYVSNFVPLEYQGLVEPHALVMDLGDDAGRPGTQLYLRGWIYPTDASINVALSQQTRLKPTMPVLEVRDAAGRWRPAGEIGFPSGKDKTIVVDLAGIFPTADHHVRIRTNMQIYWDQAYVATDAPQGPVRMTTLPLLSADLHQRGFSRTFRKGGRYGPHWFDYDDVITESPWRPIAGANTRYGDVASLLRKPDDMYVVMAPGDESTLAFDATAAPPLPPGWTRDFLLYSDGWIKDADMNTALGDTTGPLPFHAIREYPYAPGERYPTDAAHRRYLREYHTRIVTRR